MEMTGLNVHTSHILEIACLITNKDLKVISNDINIVIHQPDKTGLTAESRFNRITVQNAEQIILKHLQTYVDARMCPLAGNSVHMDRLFLQKYMPTTDNYLHYKIIDTSTIKQLILKWNLNVPAFQKQHIHRALPDIKESIKKLEHYKKYLFDI